MTSQVEESCLKASIECVTSNPLEDFSDFWVTEEVRQGKSSQTDLKDRGRHDQKYVDIPVHVVLACSAHTEQLNTSRGDRKPRNVSHKSGFGIKICKL